jgi:phosphonate transport system permease protein
LPSRQFRVRALAAGGGTAVLAACFLLLQVNPLAPITEYQHVLRLIREMTPPNLGVLWRSAEIYNSMLETISMAFLGTLAGGVVSLLLAFLAASNTSPHPALRLAVRTMLAVERSTPNFVVVLVLLIAVGLGPFAGMLALAIGSVGMFGKLFADAIEQVDHQQLEAITATGGTRTQMIRYGVLPQVAPSLVANLFYAFDINLRGAVALGIFGAGGLGFELNLAKSVLRYRDMFAYLLIVIVLINCVEKVADHFRRRILHLGAQLK